jgi:hypothetical protein
MVHFRTIWRHIARGAVALLLVIGIGLPRAFSLEWLQEDREPPLHPTLITVDFKGKPYVVSDAAAEFPEIEFEGKLKRLYSNEAFQTRLAVAYAPGFVRFITQDASTRTLERNYKLGNKMTPDNTVSGGIVSQSGEYLGRVVANESHSDCYVAVLFFGADAAGNPDYKPTAIAFKKIGDLVAGRETEIKIASAYVNTGRPNFFIYSLIFTKGLEIRSDQSEEIARFFRRQDMIEHSEVLDHYRAAYPAADHPAVAYLRFPPLLPQDVDPKQLPPGIVAKLSVMETGEVDSLELSPVLEPNVDHAIHRALEGWLFLPRLKKGLPVRTQIEVPLGFGSS